jgi:hypothetical protein
VLFDSWILLTTVLDTYWTISKPLALEYQIPNFVASKDIVFVHPLCMLV